MKRAGPARTARVGAPPTRRPSPEEGRASPDATHPPADAEATHPLADAHADADAHPRTASFVYLASQSPRRRELLAQIGVPHRLLAAEPGAEAEALEAERDGESPEVYVQRVTRAKLGAALARWAAGGLAAAPIVCADTTVALGRRILGKPADTADAARMLRLLSGRAHRVLTAVAVAWPPGDRPALQALSRSRVRVAPLDDAAIAAYVATGEPFGKAGAYAIQGAFAARIERIEGSHSGIMGLPLFETAQLLRSSGFGV